MTRIVVRAMLVLVVSHEEGKGMREAVTGNVRRVSMATVRRIVFTLAVVAAGAIVSSVASAPAATSAIPYLWKNWTHVHMKYRHGVGKRYAHDRTSGTPVTNFYRSTRLYNIAMHYNRDLDRDRDGIACEKR